MQQPENRIVRVFISSTFRDMHAERDYLVKKLFPELRELLRMYRLEVDEIDLRWGITEEQANDGQILELCLRQIEECTYFVGILGQRYGSTVSGLPDHKGAGNSFLKGEYYSITEIEIRYALQRRTQNLKACFFFFRAEKGLERAPTEKLGTFIDDSEYSRNRLMELKQLIRNTQPVLPIFDYQTTWEPQAYDRPSEALGRLGGLEGFGQDILEQLWLSIKQDFQLDQDLPTQLNESEQENLMHLQFLDNRVRGVSMNVRTDIRAKIETYFTQEVDAMDKARPLMIAGVPGSGKSTILSLFAKELLQKPEVEWATFIHFTGASPRSSSLGQLLARLLKEVSKVTDFSYAEDRSLVDLVRELRYYLVKGSEQIKLAIIIDGIEQLEKDIQVQFFDWIPLFIPKNVRILFSISSVPSDDRVVELLDAAKKKHFQVLSITPLSLEECKQVAYDVPALAAKSLSNKQLELLLSNPAVRNPLFLRVALEELRGFSSYEQLDERIASFPTADASDAPIQEIFRQVIDRLEIDFNPSLVKTMLCYLASARGGLMDKDLVHLTELIDNNDLFPIIRQLRPYLKGGSEGWAFFHQSLLQAVRSKYLSDSQASSFFHRQLGDFYRTQEAYIQQGSSRVPNRRRAEEVCWQYAQAGLLTKAAELLCEPNFLQTKIDSGLIMDLINDIGYCIVHSAPNDLNNPVELQADFPAIRKALQQNTAFLTKHPQLLFQVLWNNISPSSLTESEAKRFSILPYTGLHAPDWLQKWRFDPSVYKRAESWIRLHRPFQSKTISAIKVEHLYIETVWSPDSNYLYIRGEKRLYIWSVKNQERPIVEIPLGEMAEYSGAIRWSPTSDALIIEVVIPDDSGKRSNEINVFTWSTIAPEENTFVFEIKEQNVFRIALEWDLTGVYIFSVLKILKDNETNYLMIVMDRLGNQWASIVLTSYVSYAFNFYEKDLYPGTNYAACILNEREVHLWQPFEEEVSYVCLMQGDNKIERLDWSPDGLYLACFYNTFSVTIWDMKQLDNPLFDGGPEAIQFYRTYWKKPYRNQRGNSRWNHRTPWFEWPNKVESEFIPSPKRFSPIAYLKNVFSKEDTDLSDFDENSILIDNDGKEWKVEGNSLGEFKVSDPIKGEQRVIKAHEAGIVDLGWSPDGTALVSHDNWGNLFLWDRQQLFQEEFSLKSLLPIKLSEGKWDPRGRYFAGLHDQWESGAVEQTDRILIWSAASGTLLKEIELELDYCDDFAWSPDGNELAIILSPRNSSYEKGPVLWIYNLEEQHFSILYLPHTFSRMRLSYAPNGKKIAVISRYSEVDILEVKWKVTMLRGGKARWYDGMRRSIFLERTRSIGQRLFYIRKNQTQKITPDVGFLDLSWSPNGSKLALFAEEGFIFILSGGRIEKIPERLEIPADIYSYYTDRDSAGFKASVRWVDVELYWDANNAERLHLRFYDYLLTFDIFSKQVISREKFAPNYDWKHHGKAYRTIISEPSDLASSYGLCVEDSNKQTALGYLKERPDSFFPNPGNSRIWAVGIDNQALFFTLEDRD